MKLRDYQLKAHEEMIKGFKKSLNVLLVVMAGGGKSITAGSFIDKYHQHFKFVLIVRKRDLVEQLAEDALETFGLDYSIFMAGHEKMDLSKSIQVCSKDTMQARKTLPFIGQENVVVMVDEADEFPDYQREILKEYKTNAERVFYFGMTATPYNGLDFFDKAIQPITPKELRARGILVDFKMYIPKKLNLKELEVINGAFKSKDLLKKLNTPSAIAESFNAWLEYGDNRQTLVFSINRAHSIATRDYINNYYSKEIAVHIDAKTSPEDREKVKQQFRNGQIRFLLVVGLFKRGTNIPEIGCILDQAPTLSINNHIQKLGRGSRKNDFYADCILIDVANNLLVNGHFYQEREVDLSSKYKKTKKDLEDLAMRVCEKCFRAAETKDFGTKNICPYCGNANSPIEKKKLSKYMKNKIFMETATEEAIEQKKMINDYKKILWKKKNMGIRYRNDIAREKACMDMLKKYGIEKVSKIAKSIGLKNSTIDNFKREQYVPLGGLDI